MHAFFAFCIYLLNLVVVDVYWGSSSTYVAVVANYDCMSMRIRYLLIAN